MNQKRSPKLLNQSEINALNRSLIITKPWLTIEQYDNLINYINVALEENRTGDLIKHQDDPWSIGLSMRNGATSVMGTVNEFLCIARLKAHGKDSYFAHSQHEQKSENVDLYIVDNQESNIKVQIKQAVYELNNSAKIRLGNDYFCNCSGKVSLVDCLMLSSIKNNCCYLLPHDVTYEYFQHHKIKEHDNQYCYVAIVDLLKGVGGLLL